MGPCVSGRVEVECGENTIMREGEREDVRLYVARDEWARRRTLVAPGPRVSGGFAQATNHLPAITTYYKPHHHLAHAVTANQAVMATGVWRSVVVPSPSRA